MVPHSSVIFVIGRKLPTGVSLIGTGFPIAGNKVATTAHVSGATDNDLVVILPKSGFKDYQDTTDNSINTIEAKIAEYDPIKDIAILEIDANIQFAYLLGATGEVDVGDPIFSLGYPHADHGRMVLTYQSGTIGARVLLNAQGIKTKHLILNSQARPGQSGSPIFKRDGSKVVAMLIGSYAPGGGGGINLGGVDPHTLHQTTHALSVEYIQELL